jgi:hypothetical protein
LALPTPLRWHRRPTIAVLVRREARAVRALVAGPFGVWGDRYGYTLVHLPTQAWMLRSTLQRDCKAVAERLAELDLNWWTCHPEEVTGPDLEGMRKLYDELRRWPLVEIPFRL